MEKSIITTGKTIDLAIAAAAAQLNMDRDNFSVEVLENAKSGFLGIGASPAKIKVTYETLDDEPAVKEPTPALSSASRSKSNKPRRGEEAQAKQVEVKKPAAPARQPEAKLDPKKESKPEPKKPAKPERKKEAAPKADKVEAQPKADKVEVQPKAEPVTPAEAGAIEAAIEKFLKGLLEHMECDAVPQAKRTEDGFYHVDLVGNDMGRLIGRRGETLDAIQHLTNYAVNRDVGKRYRVIVDAENYRGKREDSLSQLAQKVAAKAVRYRRNFTLEPMNAYERHVIHTALQATPNVTTFSTGTEPNRRIVVAYTRDEK